MVEMSVPFAESPLDAYRGGRNNPTPDEVLAAEKRFWAVMAKAQAPKVCPCHPPVTDVTVTVPPETRSALFHRNSSKCVSFAQPISLAIGNSNNGNAESK